MDGRPTFRRLLPDSLGGWIILVLLAGLAVSHLLAFTLYAGNRVEALAAAGVHQAADRIAGTARLLVDAAPDRRREVVRAVVTPGLLVSLAQVPAVEETAVEEMGVDETAARGAETLLTGRLARVGAIHARVGPPPELPAPGFLGSAPPPFAMMHGHGRFAGHPARGAGFFHGVPYGRALIVSVRLDEDMWANFLAPLDVGESWWTPRFALLLLGLTGLVGGLTVWAVRRATRPFAALAAAAERLGVDVAAPPLAVSGPVEVRRAAAAFNEMQVRLRRFIEDRTRMLAAVSHDLRTPITRLRLRAEFIDDDEAREKVLSDLAEMETMIAATLSFARDDAAAEPWGRVDLGRLLAELCADFDAAGRPASYCGPESLVTGGRPLALKRAFANLINNACAYGTEARLTLITPADGSPREPDPAGGPGRLRVTVDDTGPGIPAAELDRVFAPFVRLEASRCRETGGAGLGLAVVRSIIRGHGGDVALSNRPEGGLRATVSLPAP